MRFIQILKFVDFCAIFFMGIVWNSESFSRADEDFFQVDNLSSYNLYIFQYVLFSLLPRSFIHCL